MTYRRSKSALTFLVALLALPLLGGPGAAGAEIKVDASLSSQELASPQPVELTLSAVSSAVIAGAPDLSVLEPDFQVLDRRVERRTSVTNGRRREEVRLRLVLLPRRAGELEIPAIPFGSARSQPLRLRVEGEAIEKVPEAPRAPAGAPLSQGAQEPLGPFFSGPFYPSFYPSFYPDWTSDLLSVPADGPGVINPPTWDPAMTAEAPRSAAPITPTPPMPPTQPGGDGTSLFGNPWFWTSLTLAAALVGLLGRRRRSFTGTRATGSDGIDHGSPEQKTPPPDPLETAVETVRSAYLRGDGSGAREALLTWGRLRWPKDPPGNLARLAHRCPPPLRDHITQLEKAFFSPEPIHWERDPVPDELSAQSPSRAHGGVPV